MRFVPNNLGKVVLLMAVVLSAGWMPDALPNWEIFHEQSSASKHISFDERSFLIGGRRFFLACGSVDYARVPRELWRERLVRAKMAGFNTIVTCVPWNAHEPEMGRFDFSGNREISAFLDLCKEVGFCVVVNLGPYGCCNWDLGGFPAWLASGKKARLRTEDPEYLKYVDRWFEKLLPMVVPHQIHKGGTVIMVQLENEYEGGRGTEEDSYLAGLRRKTLELGIEVPMFHSGLHQWPLSAGDEPGVRSDTSPWFATDFLVGRPDIFGDLPEKEIGRCERGAWRILAFGGGGYNYRMLHGGTNWGYSSDSQTSTSYDCGAPIGESGALRKSYFRLKKSTMFSAAFGSILTAGRSDGKGLQVSSGELGHYVCQTPRGSIVFLENRGSQPVSRRVEIEGHPKIPMVKPVTLLPGEMLPVVLDLPLGSNISIGHCAVNILCIRRLGRRIFIFVYGRRDQPGEIVFQLKGALRFISGIENYIIDSTGRILIVSFDFPGEWEKKDFAFSCGFTEIQVVALSEKLAERSWFDPWRMGPAVVIGPYYVRQLAQEKKSVKIDAEFRGDEGACYIYTGGPVLPDPEKSTRLVAFELDKANLCLNGKLSGLPVGQGRIPRITGWRFASAAAEADPSFDDSGWVFFEDPPDMGAMPGAHRSFYGWYRCCFESETGGNAGVEFAFGGDAIFVFANGRFLKKIEGRGPQSVSVPFLEGKNILSILARHSGRDSLRSFSGVAGLKIATGIHGPVRISTGSGSQVAKGWRYRAGLIGEEKGWYLPEEQSALKWKPVPGEGERAAIPAFFSGRFSYKQSPEFSEVLRLKTKGLSRGTLWLNGKIIGQYVPGGEYYLPEPWLKEENLVIIADEEGRSPEKVSLMREAGATAYKVGMDLLPQEGAVRGK